MIVHIDNCLTESHVADIMSMYRSFSNSVVINDILRDRHYPSTQGHGKFMVSEFTVEEFAPFWSVIEPQLSEKYKLIYARVLKYIPGCHISPHHDGVSGGPDKNTDTSLIIQLTDPESFTGGAMMIGDNTYTDKGIGDAVYYSYDVLHGITPIIKGVRYVCNLRLKSI